MKTLVKGISPFKSGAGVVSPTCSGDGSCAGTCANATCDSVCGCDQRNCGCVTQCGCVNSCNPSCPNGVCF